jgi:hypothetical protein
MSMLPLLGIGDGAGTVFCGAIVLFVRERSAWAFIRVLGATDFVVAVVAHIAEAFRLSTWMHWRQPGSLGHYVDLAGAILGLVLLPLGYLDRIVVRDSRMRTKLHLNANSECCGKRHHSCRYNPRSIAGLR